MSGLDLVAIHTALADQIRAAVADSSKFTVKAFPSTVPRPCIEIWPDTDYVDYFGTSGPESASDVLLVVRLFLSAANAETEWLQVTRLLSSGAGHGSSIFDAVNDEPTLGGAVAEAHVAVARWRPQDRSLDIPVAISLC